MKNHLVFALLFIFIISCKSENSTQPAETAQSFEPKAGTKLFFDFYETNVEGSISDYLVEDGYYLNIAKSGTIAGKDAFLYSFFDKSNSLFSLELYSFDALNKKIYLHSSYLNELAKYLSDDVAGDSLLIHFPDDWYLIADYNANEWTLIERDIVNYNFQNTYKGTLNAKYTIKCKKGIKEVLTLNGKNYEAQEFIMTGKIDGTTAILGEDSEFQVFYENKIYFAPEIGKIKNSYYGNRNTKYSFGHISGVAMIPVKVEFSK